MEKKPDKVTAKIKKRQTTVHKTKHIIYEIDTFVIHNGQQTRNDVRTTYEGMSSLLE